MRNSASEKCHRTIDDMIGPDAKVFQHRPAGGRRSEPVDSYYITFFADDYDKSLATGRSASVAIWMSSIARVSNNVFVS